MRATIALMVLGVFTAMGSFAGVFDDAVMWCRGVRDANANGFPDQGDFPDALRLGDSTSRSHKGAANSLTTDNPDYKLKIRSEEVIEPYTGRSLGQRECLYFTSPVVEEDGSNYLYQQSFTMNDAMPSGYKLDQTNEGWTAYVRFRADRNAFATDTSQPNYVLSLGEYWSSNCGGLLLSTQGSPTNGYLRVQLGNTNVDLNGQMVGYADYHLCTNQWIDVLVSVLREKVDVFCVREGGRLLHVTSTKAPTETVNVGSSFLLGAYQANGKKVDFSSPGNYRYNFRGSIASFAFWRRKISEAEAFEFLCPADSDKLRLGVVNDSSLEFAGTGSPTVTDGTADAWRNTVPTVASGQSLTVKFPVKAHEAGLNEMLVLTTPTAATAGELSVSVNGSSVGRIAAEPGKSTCLLVKGELLTDGENTLVLANPGATAVALDCVALGGSWQVGRANTSGSEFAGGSSGLKDGYRVGDTNWATRVKANLHCGRQQSNTNFVLRFNVPLDLCACAERLRFSVKCYPATESRWSSIARNHEFRVLVNGVTQGFFTVVRGAGWKEHVVDIPMDVLTPGGECSIGLYEETPPWYPDDDVKYYAWTQFDYYRLEIRGNRTGTVLLFR